jgi:hypothetical protein
VQQSTHTSIHFRDFNFIINGNQRAGLDTFIDGKSGSAGAENDYIISEGLFAIHDSHLYGGSSIDDINSINQPIGLRPGLFPYHRPSSLCDAGMKNKKSYCSQ